MSITEQQKIEIKEFAALKPIQYDQQPVAVKRVQNDCANYARAVFPEWNIPQALYFFEMVKSYTHVCQ